MSNTVLARKWRPKTFATLVGQDHVVRALTHALERGRLHHAYLFTGTRGVGKTTIAAAIALALCQRGANVVLDTAPTGHTILLLDAAEAYHREVSRTRGDTPECVRELLPRLRDPALTKVLIVTLAESTPVHEAARLQNDLQRAGIDPYAWVINQSLLASETRDPLLVERGICESDFIATVRDDLAQRCALIAWLKNEPVGAAALADIAG